MQASVLFPAFIVTTIIIFAEIGISFHSVLMPSIKTSLGLSDQLIQNTMSVSTFALGASGLIYGGVADNFGRRKVFIFSIMLFFVSCLLCGFASSVELFLLGKIFQGIGSGSAWVVGNACLRDLFKGSEYNKVMNYVHAVAGITPALAPIIGANLGMSIGWRHTLLLFAGTIFILFLCTVIFFPETLQSKKHISVRTFVYNYILLFKSHEYTRYLVIKVLMVMLLFVEISNVPLIFIDFMGVASESYGYYVMPLLIVYILSTIISAKLVKKMHVDWVITLGVWCVLCSNLCLVTLWDFLSHSPVLIQCIKGFTYIGWGMVFGNATAILVSIVPNQSAAASAMMIALEMFCSSCGISMLGFFFNGTMLPLSIFMLGTSVMCLLYFRNCTTSRSSSCF